MGRRDTGMPRRPPRWRRATQPPFKGPSTFPCMHSSLPLHGHVMHPPPLHNPLPHPPPPPSPSQAQQQSSPLHSTSEPGLGTVLAMGQSLGTLFDGNLNALGLGTSITADEVTKNLNLKDYTAIVTGGSSGLGRECARTLAKRGAHVVLAARRVDVLQDVKSLIISETPTARVECMPLNLTNLQSVRQFAEEYKQKKMPLNILINNGGVFAKEFTPTDDGIEVMWATHVLGHYALTMMLMDKLKETAAQSGKEGRIMFTGSDAHRISYEGGINFEALTNPSLYSAYQAYGQSKTGDILLARMIGQQLKREGVNVVANSGHPGAVKTPLGQNFFEKGTTQVGYNVSKPFIKNAEQGAANLIYVATSPEIKGVSGKYFSDFKEIKPSLSAQNDVLGQKVIDYCEDFMTAKMRA